MNCVGCAIEDNKVVPADWIYDGNSVCHRHFVLGGKMKHHGIDQRRPALPEDYADYGYRS